MNYELSDQEWHRRQLLQEICCTNRVEQTESSVCGGLGEFFGLNPFWFRLLFFILLLPGGLPGLLPYLILWLIVPLDSA